MNRTISPYVYPIITENPILKKKKEKIERCVCEYFELSMEDITRKRRFKRIAYPRQILTYLYRTMLYMSLKQIGKEFGQDHTTVMSSMRKIKGFIDVSDERTVNDIRFLKNCVNDIQDKRAPVVSISKNEFKRPPAEYSNTTPYGIAGK